MVGGDIEEAKTTKVVLMLFVGDQVEQSIFVFGARAGNDLERAHDRRLKTGWGAIRVCHGDILSNAI